MFGAYPIVDYAIRTGSNQLFTNSSGMVPQIQGFRGLVDKDTPQEALTRTGYDGEDYSLVFSDEFEQEGRTFNPGDDPYWTAIDSHYCAYQRTERSARMLTKFIVAQMVRKISNGITLQKHGPPAVRSSSI